MSLIIKSNGEYTRGMKKRVQVGCRQVSGVICDKRIATGVKGKVHQIIASSKIKAEMVLTCAEDRWWINWKKYIEELPGRRKEDHKEVMVLMKEDMQRIGVTEEDDRHGMRSI